MPDEQTIPLLNAEEATQNEERKTKLIEAVQNKETILFVGSGTSSAVRYPSWEKLVDQLEYLASSVGGQFEANEALKVADPLLYVDRIKKHVQATTNSLDRYHHKLREIFSAKNPNFGELHQSLMRLPFLGVITTNYDYVLSDALLCVDRMAGTDICFDVHQDNAADISDFLYSLNPTMKIKRRVAHLHGSVGTTRRIILGEEDYKNAYDPPANVKDNPTPENLILAWTIRRKFLWSIFATRRVVFVGFGMRDPYLMKILTSVNEELWRWGGKQAHFSVMSLDQKEADKIKTFGNEQLLKRFDVMPVFYENRDGAHMGLNTLVSELMNACGPLGTQTTQEGARATAPLNPATLAPTPEAVDWLNRVEATQDRLAEVRDEA